MSIYGYARISTAKQSIERQVRNILRTAPEAIIVTEAYTGTKISRPEFDKLMKRVKAGDTVIFDSVSRMSRNADDGVDLYFQLVDRGVELVFLKEPTINTAVYQNAAAAAELPKTGTTADLILEGVTKYLRAIAREQIRIAFTQSEKEVEDLRQRTREGLITAAAAGKQVGAVLGSKHINKKSESAREIIRKHSKTFGGSLSDAEVMELAKVSRNTYYKLKREIIAAE